MEAAEGQGLTSASALSEDELRLMYWSQEREHCRRDFPYFCKTYLKIKGRGEIGLIPFVLNDLQVHFWNHILAQKARTGFVRQVVGKQRQVGMTLFWQALGFWLTAIHGNRNGMVMAHDEPTAVSLYMMNRTFYDGLPKLMQPVVGTMTRAEISFSNLHTKMFMGHSMNRNIGVSHTLHFLHISEAPRFANTAFINSSLFPALSTATDFDGWDCSVAVVEAAAEYPGHWFKSFGDMAIAGQTEWEFYFAPFYMTKEFQEPVPSDFIPTPEEAQQLNADARLRPENIMWRRKKILEYPENPSEFYRQYPLNWTEAWMVPSGSSRAFPLVALEATQKSVMRGVAMEPTTGGKLVPMPNGGVLEIWEGPQEGVRYHLGFDVAKGESAVDPERSDFSALEVIREDTLEQVAEARGKWDPAKNYMTDMIYNTATAYNMAQINPDTTGGWGHLVITQLNHRDYPNIYTRRNRINVSGDNVTEMAGLSFTKQSKRDLVLTSVSMAYDGVSMGSPLIVHSSVLFHEILNYLKVGDEMWGPAPGYKADCVTAWMLALLSAYDERALFMLQKRAAPVERPYHAPGTKLNIKRALSQQKDRVIPTRKKWRVR